MPQGDRTGPMVQGSRTGKGFGFCKGNNAPGSFGGFGRGLDQGLGFGRRRGRGVGRIRSAADFNQGFFGQRPIGKEDEIKMLKAQAESLKIAQKNLEKRLLELEKEDS